MAQTFIKLGNRSEGLCHPSQELPGTAGRASILSHMMMEGTLQDVTDKDDFMICPTKVSLGWWEEGDCSEASSKFTVHIFLTVSFLVKASLPTGWWQLLFALYGACFLLLPDMAETRNQGILTPLLASICPPRTFELTLSKDAFQVLSLFSLCLSTFSLYHRHRRKSPTAGTVIDCSIWEKRNWLMNSLFL